MRRLFPCLILCLVSSACATREPTWRDRDTASYADARAACLDETRNSLAVNADADYDDCMTRRGQIR